KQKCIHELFQEQAEQRAAGVAVCMGEQQMSYGELNRRANQLANYLIDLGGGREEMVGICMERSRDGGIAGVGVLKAGSAYVPMDSNHPLERLAYIVEEGPLAVVLTREEESNKLPSFWGRVISIDTRWHEIASCGEEDPEGRSEGGNLAYVIYTSG